MTSFAPYGAVSPEQAAASQATWTAVGFVGLIPWSVGATSGCARWMFLSNDQASHSLWSCSPGAAAGKSDGNPTLAAIGHVAWGLAQREAERVAWLTRRLCSDVIAAMSGLAVAPSVCCCAGSRKATIIAPGCDVVAAHIAVLRGRSEGAT